MKVFYCCFGEEIAYDTIINIGRLADCLDYMVKELPEYVNGLVEEELESRVTEDVDIVFSYNFFEVVARVCDRKKKKYVAWIYDWPILTVFGEEILLPCNRIYSFDMESVRYIKGLGAKHVEYMPLAVDTARLNSQLGPLEGEVPYAFDVSFVGNLYYRDKDVWLTESTPEYYIGYAKALSEAQQKIYGYNIINEVITDKFVKKYFEAIDCQIRDSVIPDSVIIAQRLNRLTTGDERRRRLAMAAQTNKVDLFTRNVDEIVENVTIHGPVNYLSEMPDIFRTSKINLNFTLRSITTGMPLRVVDILGAGGFCLTNYQECIGQHFVDGRDLVLFHSEQDMLDKITYYMQHEEERRQIAINGHQAVQKLNYADAFTKLFYAGN